MPERQGLDTGSRILILEKGFDRLERRVDKNSEMREDIAVLRTEFHAFASHMEDKFDGLEKTVEMDVKGLRRTLIVSGGSVLVGAVGFAITSLAVFGAPG